MHLRTQSVTSGLMLLLLEEEISVPSLVLKGKLSKAGSNRWYY